MYGNVGSKFFNIYIKILILNIEVLYFDRKSCLNSVLIFIKKVI